MFRTGLSKPVALALDDEVIRAGDTCFDYGCGRGADVAGLNQLGFATSGWDPVHSPETTKTAADVVNLGYVVNVIENPPEREAALREAWQLCRRALLVSARLDWDINQAMALPCGDGVVTSKRTFQKFFTQDELRGWIQQVLGVEADPAGPGIFYVFRSPEERERHLARGVRRTYTTRFQLPPDVMLDQNRAVLTPLLDFLSDYGRAPIQDELPSLPAIEKQFGSLPRAIRLLDRAIPERPWEQVAIERQRDLLVYLALGTLRKRPPLRALPSDLQADIRAFFGSYDAGAKLGKELLFAAGQQKAISEECAAAPVGKLMPDSLYVHVSAVQNLPVLLRVYEGCARSLLGEIPQATLVKLRRDNPKVSYLCYPTFDDEGHPALTETFVADLRKLRTDHYDYANRDNPPVLHRKECFVAEGYPQRELFRALTYAEESAGLLDDAVGIGTAKAWEQRLAQRGYRIDSQTLVPIGTRVNPV